MSILSQIPTRPKRIKEPRHLWITRVHEFQNSGLSLSRFCRTHDLKVSTLHNWVRRLSKPLPERGVSTEFNALSLEESSTIALREASPKAEGSLMFKPFYIRPDQNEEEAPQNIEASAGSNTSQTCPRTSNKIDPSTFSETASTASSITEAASSSLRLIFGSFTLEIPKEVEIHRVQSLLPILLSLTSKA